MIDGISLTKYFRSVLSPSRHLKPDPNLYPLKLSLHPDFRPVDRIPEKSKGRNPQAIIENIPAFPIGI